MATTQMNVKRCFNSASALNADLQVPIEPIASFAKQDLPALNGNPAEYNILFAMKPGFVPSKFVLKYVDDATRNTAIAAVKVYVSEPLT